MVNSSPWRRRAFIPTVRLTMPTRCLLCAGDCPKAADFCESCRQDLPWLTPGCRRCAIPLPHDDDGELCGQCLRQPPRFHRTEAGWLYRPPLSSLVAAYKYRRNLSYGRSLSMLMAERLASAYLNDDFPDLITAVPLHWWRRLRRGFNQSEVIALQLARELNIPYHPLLKRTRSTPPQQSLNADQRRHNLKQAFCCARTLGGECIALVDDVMTTGATVNEISRILLDAGAAKIHVWCLARTPE